MLLASVDAGAANAQMIEYDPTRDASFAKGMVLSEFAAPRWSKDGTRITLGLKEQDAEPARGDEPPANVDVWHWKDPDPQSVQIVRLNQERRFTYPAVFAVPSSALLPSSAMPTPEL